MYIFTKTTAGVLVNYPSDTILNGGGGNNDTRQAEEIIPLGLVFKKPKCNFFKKPIVPIAEPLDDKKIDKLYKKVKINPAKQLSH